MSAPSSSLLPGSPWNFNAGPSALPTSVLAEAAANLQQYGGPLPQGSGISVMCMSHRSPTFESIIASAERNCRELLNIPDNYAVLFLSGGGTGAFASVPLNLAASQNDKVSYLVSGSWSAAAAKEAAKFAQVEIIGNSVTSEGGYAKIPEVSEWKSQPSPHSKYLHLCYNETVHGIAYPDLPVASAPLPTIVADMSSCFMSAPVDVSRYGVIYAGVQKNVGPSGITIYIIRKDLLTPGPQKICPAILDWKLFAGAGSMYNTPCTWSIYITNLVFEWIKKQGGLAAIEKQVQQKADLVYGAIDASEGFYRAFVSAPYRSKQNIVFMIPQATDNPTGTKQDKDLQTKFINESEAAGLIGLAGHRSLGAMRASLYNGLPLEGAQALVDFMKQFQLKYQKKKE